MNKLLIIVLLQVVFVGLTFSQTTQTDLKLWYNKPGGIYEFVKGKISNQ